MYLSIYYLSIYLEKYYLFGFIVLKSILAFFLSLVDMLLDTKELPHLLAREIFDSFR
jgi:hypothetical protein